MRYDPPLPDKAVRENTASPSHAGTRIDVTLTSTRKALLFVDVSYFARYLQLLIVIPFYERVLGAAEYGKMLAAMSVFNLVWMIVQSGFPVVGIRDMAGTTDQAAMPVQFGRQIKARLLMSVVGIAFGACGIAFSPLLRANPVYGVIATALGVVAAFNVRWSFQANHRFRTSILLEVAGFAITARLYVAWCRQFGVFIFDYFRQGS